MAASEDCRASRGNEASDCLSAVSRFEPCLQGFRDGSAQTMPRPQPSERRLFRLKEAARYLCLSPWKLRGIIQAGHLPIVKYAENVPWLLDVRDLDGWVERNKQIIE